MEDGRGGGGDPGKAAGDPWPWKTNLHTLISGQGRAEGLGRGPRGLNPLLVLGGSPGSFRDGMAPDVWHAVWPALPHLVGCIYSHFSVAFLRGVPVLILPCSPLLLPALPHLRIAWPQKSL